MRSDIISSLIFCILSARGVIARGINIFGTRHYSSRHHIIFSHVALSLAASYYFLARGIIARGIILFLAQGFSRGIILFFHILSLPRVILSRHHIISGTRHSLAASFYFSYLLWHAAFSCGIILFASMNIAKIVARC